MQHTSVPDRLAHHGVLMPSRCERGKPGPHHYECDPPKDALVHCVCRICGDERDYPAAGEDIPKASRHPWLGGTDVPEDESASDLSQIETEIDAESAPDLDQNCTESVPVEIQEKEEVIVPSKAIQAKHAEYEANKDQIIETWRRLGENGSATSEALKIPKSSLFGKLRQWGLVPKAQKAPKRAKQCRHEERKEEIIAVYLATKGRDVLGHNTSEAAGILEMNSGSLRSKLEQWGIMPVPPSHKKWGWPRIETSTPKPPPAPTEASTGASGPGAIAEVKRLLEEAGERRVEWWKVSEALETEIAALETVLRLLEAKAVPAG